MPLYILNKASSLKQLCFSLRFKNARKNKELFKSGGNKLNKAVSLILEIQRKNQNANNLLLIFTHS